MAQISLSFKTPAGQSTQERRWAFDVRNKETGLPVIRFEHGEPCDFPKAFRALQQQLSSYQVFAL